MRLAETRREVSEDNIVPLINIVFLLLIFFMIAGTLAAAPDREIALIETLESPGAPPPVAAVTIGRDGGLTYRGMPVGLDVLAETVAGDDERAVDQPLPVVVDRALPAAELGPVFDALAAGGVTQLRLITRKGTS